MQTTLLCSIFRAPVWSLREELRGIGLITIKTFLGCKGPRGVGTQWNCDEGHHQKHCDLITTQLPHFSYGVYGLKEIISSSKTVSFQHTLPFNSQVHNNVELLNENPYEEYFQKIA